MLQLLNNLEKEKQSSKLQSFDMRWKNILDTIQRFNLTKRKKQTNNKEAMSQSQEGFAKAWYSSTARYN